MTKQFEAVVENNEEAKSPAKTGKNKKNKKGKKDMENMEVMNNEFVADSNEEVKAEVPATEVKTEEFVNNAGEVVTKSAFIREKFLVDNMSKKDISEKYNIPYRSVYGATMNLTNDAAETPRGRQAQNIKVFMLGDTVVEEGTEGAVEVNRNEYIQEKVNGGSSRADMAELFGLSYGYVYGLTKEAAGTKNKHMVEGADGTLIARTEYIKQRFEAGVSKADIAKELDVAYNVVWQALKVEKSNTEKFAEAIDHLDKFKANVAEADVVNFEHAIELLKAINIVDVAVTAE